MKISLLIPLLLTFCFLGSCSADFDPISFGHDACAHCKMTIIDKRFAAEILTKKGKAFKFDDIACLRQYMKQENLSASELRIFVADYSDPDNKFLDACRVVYLHNEIFRSPMNGSFAAFAKAESAVPFQDSLHIDLLKWENLN